MSEIKSVVLRLPEQASLENLKKRARALLNDARAGDRESQARVLVYHPSLAQSGVFEAARFNLSAAQLVIAREYGFASWSKLKVQLVQQRVRAALVVPAGATLPILDLGGRVLCPYSTLNTAFDSGVSAQAIDVALAATGGYALCLARLGDADGVSPVGAIAQVSKARGANGVELVRLRYQGRARVTRRLTRDGYAVAEISPWAELGLSAPDTRAAVEQLYRALEPVARRVEWVPSAHLAKLHGKGDLPQLIAAAATLCTSSQKQALLEGRDQRAMVDRLCDVLALLVVEPAPSARIEGSAFARDAHAEPAYLLVLSADEHPHLVGRRYSLGDACTSIGRAAESTVPLHSDAISRQHARIECEGGDFVLYDQSSTNGTFVGRATEAVARHVLADGDRITIGAAMLAFLRAPDLDAKYREAIAHLAEFDPFTCARTQHAWHAQSERLVLHARGSAGALSVLMLEVGPLVALAERCGRLAGNALLVASAELLGRDLPVGALLGHCEDAHLALTLPECDADQALRVVETLRARCAASELNARGERVQVTLTIGVATLAPTIGFDQLCSDALASLRRARRRGPAAAA